MSNPVKGSTMNLRSTTTTPPSPSPNTLPISTPKSPLKTPLSPTSKSPFGRVFTQEDEIKLLKAFKRSLSKNPNSITSSLSFQQFTHAQISSKLKRLKEKYHKMAKTKSKIKTSQDREIYSIARKIWGKKVIKIQPYSRNAQNGENFKKDMIFEGGNVENEDNFKTPNEEISKDMFVEYGNDGNLKMGNGGDLESGKDEVDLEKFPFLMEEIPEEVKKIGDLYFEGLKRLGEGGLKELDDKWMVLSIMKTEIETEKSLLFQKQFILVADARRKM